MEVKNVEEKILLLLAEMKKELTEMKQEMTGMKQELVDVKQELTGVKQEMAERFDETDRKFDNVYVEMDHLRKEILDKQFLFEDEYGKKIDAIFEYVQFHQKINLQRFDKINELEKRVSILEQKQI